MDDYGHYGSGTEGYIHYMQEQEKGNSRRGGGGGGGGGWGWGRIIIAALIIIQVLSWIGSCSS